MASRKIFRCFLYASFLMFILLSVFQGIILLSVFQGAEIALAEAARAISAF